MGTWLTMMQNRISKQVILRVFLICTLLAVVGIEGYYIYVLRNIIEKQSEELNHTSLQIQALRHERVSLEDELHLIKKTAGEKNDGTTAQRQH
ncbi:MAG: hypothetical protein C0402_02495 [Thermodesulfovibrio sp.]|nr:hypothetical protein [Thermodesulfovibrio sp.]